MQLILSSHNDKKRRGMQSTMDETRPFEHMDNGKRKKRAVQGSIRYCISGLLGKLGKTKPQFSGIQFISPNYFSFCAVKTESNNDQI